MHNSMFSFQFVILDYAIIISTRSGCYIVLVPHSKIQRNKLNKNTCIVIARKVAKISIHTRETYISHVYRGGDGVEVFKLNFRSIGKITTFNYM